MESGRAVAELIGRELEQVSACYLSNGINLYAEMTRPPVTQMDVAQNPSQPPLRTNVLFHFFFLSRQTNKWYGTGYRVLNADDGVGTLYRIHSGPADNYGVNSTNTLTWTNLAYRFGNELPTNSAGQLSTNFNRVAEGIVHFRLTAYDPEGRRMDAGTTNLHSSYRILNLQRSGSVLGAYSTANTAADANVILQADPLGSGAPWTQTRFRFISNALPGYLEFELGILEPTTMKQYQAMKGTPAAAKFLSKQAGKVHLFRQRIPFRTVQQ